MEMITDYKRINVGLCKDHRTTVIKDGEKVWNINFLERLEDYNVTFDLMLYDLIIGWIGKDGWAVQFIQMEEFNPTFMIEVFTDDKANFPIIKRLIEERITDIKIRHIFDQGNISDYLTEYSS